MTWFGRMLKFDPNQPRDKIGRWTDGGSGGLSSYVRSYRGEQGFYDPAVYDKEPDQLTDDDGKVVAEKERLVPRPGVSFDIPAKASDGIIFRGMSAAEFEDLQKQGRVQSKGSYNIGEDQEGLTYFTTDPSAAASYANSFAPAQYKPAPGKHAYVVAVKRPPSDRIKRVEGTGEHEVGVVGPVSADDVVDVFRGRVVAYTPEIKEKGFQAHASATVVWERVNLR